MKIIFCLEQRVFTFSWRPIFNMKVWPILMTSLRTFQDPLWCCVCIINSYSTLLNWPIVSLLILFILFRCFFLIHDYTLCFTGSPCCNFSYYNYISIWPYYIVIHFTNLRTHLFAEAAPFKHGATLPVMDVQALLRKWLILFSAEYAHTENKRKFTLSSRKGHVSYQSERV